jgi:hypothetical protein
MVNANAVTSVENILLIDAVRSGEFIDAIKLLSWNDIDIDFQENDGKTPLMWAIRGGKQIIFDLLIKHGANVSIVDKANRTPLMYAAMYFEYDFAETILGLHQSNINDKDCNGRTALFYAAEQAGTSMLRLLLDLGADPAIVNKKGETALHAAIRANRSEQFHYLFFRQLKSLPADQSKSFIIKFNAAINTHRMAELIFKTIRATTDELEKFQLVRECLTPLSSLFHYIQTELKPTDRMILQNNLRALSNQLSEKPICKQWLEQNQAPAKLLLYRGISPNSVSGRDNADQISRSKAKL